MAKKPFHPKNVNVELEDEPSLSQSAKELISLAEQFGENLAKEVDKDTLLKLINDLRRKDVHVVNRILRSLGFDISPLVYGALEKRAQEIELSQIIQDLKRLAGTLED